jgi:hypothetical protein
MSSENLVSEKAVIPVLPVDKPQGILQGVAHASSNARQSRRNEPIWHSRSKRQLLNLRFPRHRRESLGRKGGLDAFQGESTPSE